VWAFVDRFRDVLFAEAVKAEVEEDEEMDEGEEDEKGGSGGGGTKRGRKGAVCKSKRRSVTPEAAEARAPAEAAPPTAAALAAALADGVGRCSFTLSDPR